MPGRARLVVLILGLAALLLPLVPTELGRAATQSTVQFACMVLAWSVLMRRRHVIRHGWGLLVAAMTVLAASDLAGWLESDVLGVPVRTDPSTVLAVVGYLLLGIAVVQIERHRSSEEPLPGAIEAGIFATGVLTPLLVFLIIPTVQRGDLSARAMLVTIAYALVDLVVISVIARLVISGGSQPLSLGYLSAALFTSIAGDVVVGGGDVDSGAVAPVARVLWCVAFVLFAAGIAHPSMQRLRPDRTSQPPRHRRVWLMALGQAMPALALLVEWLLNRHSTLLVEALGALLVSLLARSDDLTGLHNRRSWNFELKRAATAAVAQGQPLVVALLDLDHFKVYNDTYGHPAGDRLLKAATSAWQSALQPGELLARYGGEEFAMLLAGSSLDEAVARVETLRGLMPGGQSFSGGVALWCTDEDPEQTVANADAALYEAKRRGRGMVLPFRSAAPVADTVLPYSMRTLVQPIVRVSDLAVVGYEGLSRFDPISDVKGVFAQAHQDGYGDVLERAAILSALRLPDRPRDVEIFVNVSQRALSSPYFWQSMPPRMDGIVVELQEHRTELHDPSVGPLLDRFRDRGARICLDDLVGSVAELERMIALRVDVVKVDRSLVSGCDHSPEMVPPLERLLAFAVSYGVGVVAQGVESVGELRVLRRIGMPLVQGYLLGYPEPHWVEPLAPSLRLHSVLDPQPVTRRAEEAPPGGWAGRLRVSGRSGH
jgi:diguanylate cyclase (GGDEF)-like protein